jgi:hypothetical protein
MEKKLAQVCSLIECLCLILAVCMHARRLNAPAG